MSVIIVHMKFTYFNNVCEVFRLSEFVNKISCTEYYSEFHKTKYIYENHINYLMTHMGCVLIVGDIENWLKF